MKIENITREKFNLLVEKYGHLEFLKRIHGGIFFQGEEIELVDPPIFTDLKDVEKQKIPMRVIYYDIIGAKILSAPALIMYPEIIPNEWQNYIVFLGEQEQRSFDEYPWIRVILHGKIYEVPLMKFSRAFPNNRRELEIEFLYEYMKFPLLPIKIAVWK